VAAVTIVVPTRNEPNLAQWLETLHASVDAEVVVVDDSISPIGELPHARLIRGPDRGKGAAVGVGILAAEGEVIVVVDADLDQPTMMRIPEFVDRIRGGYDVVIGERTRWRYDNFGRFILSIGLFFAQRLLIFHTGSGAEVGKVADGGRRDVRHRVPLHRGTEPLPHRQPSGHAVARDAGHAFADTPLPRHRSG